MLCSRILFLFTRSIYKSLRLLTSASHSVPPQPASPWQPPVCSRCPWFCFFFKISDWRGFSSLPCLQAGSSCGSRGLLCVAVPASRWGGFSVAEHGLWVGGSQWLQLMGLGAPWRLPRPGIEPMSPALAGGFLSTGSPGKPCFLFHRYVHLCHILDSTLISYGICLSLSDLLYLIW